MAVLKECGNAAYSARDNGLACGHPLEYRERHTLEARGADEDVHRRHETGHLFVCSMAEKSGRNAQLLGKSLEPGALRSVTYHDESQLGPVRSQPAKSPQCGLELFFRAQSTDCPDDPISGRQAELTSGSIRVSVWVIGNPVGDEDDFPGGDALEFNHALTIGRRHGDNGIGTPRDQLAIDDPTKGPLVRTRNVRGRAVSGEGLEA